MLNGLDLFSGIGGISLALAQWVRPVAYCENDRYCQAVLLSRMSDGTIGRAPIWDDVTTLLPEMLPRSGIDIIYGGFPCQDISIAGDGAGLDGKRSRLFFEVARLVGEIRPRFVFLENVAAIRARGADVVAARLASLGYDARWFPLSAAAVGANHLRNRWFLLASNLGGSGHPRMLHKSETQNARSKPAAIHRKQTWEAVDLSVADLGRRVHGIRHRVDRVKGLGNGVVPPQIEEAFVQLSGTGRVT